jgi:hypothetical protein
MSPETAVYNILKNAAEKAAEDSPFFNVDIQPTVYSVVKETKTIRIGNCESSFAPVGETVKEFDADITIQILHKVADSENADDYPIATDAVRDLTMATANLFLERGLDGEYCNNYKLMPAFRGYSNVQTGVNATALLPMRINPTD